MYVLAAITTYHYINLMVLSCKTMIYTVINYFTKKCVCLLFLVGPLINIKASLIDFKLPISRTTIDFETRG